MSDNFAACLAVVLREEGGFVNSPNDPGGVTNLGVTLKTWQAWVGRPVDIDEMHALTPQMVRPLYQRNYWNADSCQALPAGIDLCVMDFGVNSGPGVSARTLQSMVGAAADGSIGPATIAAVQAYVKAQGIGPVIDAYQAARLTYDKSRSGWGAFGNGWSARIVRVKAGAHALAAQSPQGIAA